MSQLNKNKMVLQIDRTKKLILLKWPKQGCIDTLDLPEAYKNSRLFMELLMKTGTIHDEKDKLEFSS